MKKTYEPDPKKKREPAAGAKELRRTGIKRKGRSRGPTK